GDIALAAAGRAKKVIAVEKDKLLCKILEDRFRIAQISTDERLTDRHRLEVVCADILKLNLTDIAGEGRNITVIGNPPYYITTPIIFRLIEYKDVINSIFITVQREVADRITAAASGKDYGVLSCMVQYHTHPRILFDIKREHFYPQPGVDSAFLKLERLKSPPVSVKDEALFFKIIKAGFNQRRKTLLNALHNLKVADKTRLSALLRRIAIEPERRAETLSLEEFARVSDELTGLGPCLIN
ncbi:MAG: ribosomal RNA small subunit methyltransferase A, partial [Bacteroidetes bacterium RIFCSPHIGHO2_02_FULL_44_7]